MKPPFPSFTKEWHNTTYPAISPLRPELSAAGKTIVITGAGTGIGQSTARAFAEAGAAHVAILGRRENLLVETKKLIEGEFPNTRVSVHAADVTQKEALRKAAGEIGAWDVLVLNAGFLAENEPVATANVDDWWSGFEINIKGAMLTLQAFLPSKKAKPAVIGISTAAFTLPMPLLLGGTSYNASKLGVTKFFEIFAAENPDIHVSILHPGIVETDMFHKSPVAKKIPPGVVDDVSLPAHFIVWSASPEASFTSGKFIAVNWDVDELKSKAAEIKETQVLTSSILGIPEMQGE